MGWLFGWETRKRLVEHLTQENGVKTLRSASVGNNLWCVHELSDGRRFICLYLIKGPPFGRADRHGWGYKDVDECMGPNEISCPISFLALAQPEPTEGYAVGWRERVRERHAHLSSLKTGVKVRYDERAYTIVKRRSPSSWLLRTEHGTLVKAGTKIMTCVEAVCSTNTTVENNATGVCVSAQKENTLTATAASTTAV